MARIARLYAMLVLIGIIGFGGCLETRDRDFVSTAAYTQLANKR